jgi:hypothetical protein
MELSDQLHVSTALSLENEHPVTSRRAAQTKGPSDKKQSFSVCQVMQMTSEY